MLKESTKRAIAKYGRQTCLDAFRQHHAHGDGASTIGFCLGLKTQQADAAIEAGRDIVNNDKDWSDLDIDHQ